MSQYVVKIYQDSDFKIWNDFIDGAKNATFLFQRNFMEYHKDRFEDFSLLIFEKQKLMAVLPANRVGDTVFSHQGLSYGGLVYNEKIKLAAIISLFKALLFFLNENKIATIQLKLIPSLYHQKPAEELNYALFLVKAQLLRRDTTAVIDLMQKNNVSKLRKRSIQKGISNNFIIQEVNEFDAFWNKILIPNLAQKHQAKPVHSLQEIIALKLLFSENIKQFNVYLNGLIVAGATIFETKNVAHCQYISGREDKNELGGLDLLFHHLIINIFANKRFFDFGISNQNQGKKLNNGLSYWKESFGASTIVHDFYEVQTSNYYLLENVLQ